MICNSDFIEFDQCKVIKLSSISSIEMTSDSQEDFNEDLLVLYSILVTLDNGHSLNVATNRDADVVHKTYHQILEQLSRCNSIINLEGN